MAGAFASLTGVVNAQTAMTQKTYAIADAIPDRIGLGETTLLKCGVTEALESADLGWNGLTIVVTKPDGTNRPLAHSQLTQQAQPSHRTHQPNRHIHHNNILPTAKPYNILQR